MSGPPPSSSHRNMPPVSFTPHPVARDSPAWAPLQVPHDRTRPFTDYARWRLKVSDGGRHIWHFLPTDEEVAAWPQNTVDKYWLGLETVSMSSGTEFACQVSDLFARGFLHCQKRRRHTRRLGMDMNSTNTCSQKMDTGRESMADPCSSSLVSLLEAIFPTWVSLCKSDSR